MTLFLQSFLQSCQKTLFGSHCSSQRICFSLSAHSGRLLLPLTSGSGICIQKTRLLFFLHSEQQYQSHTDSFPFHVSGLYPTDYRFSGIDRVKCPFSQLKILGRPFQRRIRDSGCIFFCCKIIDKFLPFYTGK